MHDDLRDRPNEPLVITITEAAAGRHEARHRQVLLCRSAQPLLDGARALLTMGCPPPPRPRW
ncbi:MAG: hypothetical protein K2Z80_27930 [Xanthobacteraceae bacterium]|nr:hypothetical protein [Xanthobacteraceae bacterium]